MSIKPVVRLKSAIPSKMENNESARDPVETVLNSNRPSSRRAIIPLKTNIKKHV